MNTSRFHPTAHRRSWPSRLVIPRALFLVCAVSVLALSGPAHASPVVVHDTLGTATPDTTFSVFGSGGQGVASELFVGPQFTLTERTTITEVGGFVNVCETIIGGVPQCPPPSPFVVELRRSVNGLPDPSGVLGSFTLSHDDDPLVVSYESAAPNLTLEPGAYFALFRPQGSDGGFWLGSSGSTYVAPVATVGFLFPTTGVALVGMVPGAARVLGEPPFAPPTNKDQCKEDGWETFKNPNFENQGACVSYVVTHSRNGGDA